MTPHAEASAAPDEVAAADTPPPAAPDAAPGATEASSSVRNEAVKEARGGDVLSDSIVLVVPAEALLGSAL